MIKNFKILFDKKIRKKLLFYQLSAVFQGILEATGVIAVLPLMLMLLTNDKNEIIDKFSSFEYLLLDHSLKEIQIALLVFFVFLVVLINIFISINFLYSENVTKYIYKNIFSRILKKYLSFNINSKTILNPSESINNLTYNLHSVNIHVFRNLVRGLPKLYTFILIIIVMFYVDFIKSFIFISIFLSIYLLILKNVKSKFNVFGKVSSKTNEKIILNVREIINNIKIVYIDRLQNIFEKKINSLTDKHAYAQKHLQNYTFLIKIFVETIAILLIFSLMFFTIITDQNSLMIPIVSFYLYGFYRSFPAMQSIFTFYTMIKAWSNSLDHLSDTLSMDNENIKYNEKEINFKDNIIFKNISFSYENPELFILKNFNSKIKTGELLGVCGPSGSGKTTFIDILSGIKTPTKGEIKIDDQKITNHNIYSWFKKISYVPQRIILLNETIEDNILLGRDFGSDKTFLDKLIKITNLQTLILSKENGIHETVFEDGNNLSGGEIQRIGIARALLKKPKILILDETTSGIELSMEKEIIKNIREFLPKITIILVSHRRDSLNSCDNILTFGN
jgi:ATP-binding cassette, subfamily B, bacterial PglK